MFKSRLHGRASASSFRVRYKAGFYQAGEPILRGSVVREGNGSRVEGSIRPGNWMLLVCAVFGFGALAGLVSYARDGKEALWLSVLSLALVLLEVARYIRNRQRAVDLLESLVSEPIE